MTATEIITKYVPLNCRIGVGVSGGVDSISLLHLAVSVLGKDRVVALHVEHGIRGESSQRDCDFVNSYCEENGIECLSYHLDIPRLALQNKISVETQARISRKEIFSEFVESKKGKFVLLAHNRNDQEETVLMHVLRGSGISGLAGMSEKDGYILRPFIDTPRCEIEQYAKDNNLNYCVDETNLQNDYDRNFIRNEIMPLLSKRYDTQSLARLAKVAHEHLDFIKKSMDFSLIKEDDGAVTLPISLIRESALANEYILYALKQIGLSCDVESKHIALVKDLANMENGSVICLPHEVLACKEYDVIAVYKKEEIECFEEEYAFGMTVVENGVINVFATDVTPKTGKIVFDADKIPDGSVFRFRRDGDVFKPYKSGTKKLKEYFIDKKIPQRKRDTILLLCKDDEVLVVCGIQISDKVKVDEKTQVKAEMVFDKD